MVWGARIGRSATDARRTVSSRRGESSNLPKSGAFLKPRPPQEIHKAAQWMAFRHRKQFPKTNGQGTRYTSSHVWPFPVYVWRFSMTIDSACSTADVMIIAGQGALDGHMTFMEYPDNGA